MNWISVKESMPDRKEHKCVLTFEYVEHVKTKKKLPMICLEETSSIQKDKDGVWSHGGGEDITHWMPLPEPPISDEDRAKITITKEKWKAK